MYGWACGHQGGGAITMAFPKTEYQRYIVHRVRNTLKYVPDKDRKAFITDLRFIRSLMKGKSWQH